MQDQLLLLIEAELYFTAITHYLKKSIEIIQAKLTLEAQRQENTPDLSSLKERIKACQQFLENYTCFDFTSLLSEGKLRHKITLLWKKVESISLCFEENSLFPEQISTINHCLQDAQKRNIEEISLLLKAIIERWALQTWVPLLPTPISFQYVKSRIPLLVKGCLTLFVFFLLSFFSSSIVLLTIGIFLSLFFFLGTDYLIIEITESLFRQILGKILPSKELHIKEKMILERELKTEKEILEENDINLIMVDSDVNDKNVIRAKKHDNLAGLEQKLDNQMFIIRKLKENNQKLYLETDAMVALELQKLKESKQKQAERVSKLEENMVLLSNMNKKIESFLLATESEQDQKERERLEELSRILQDTNNNGEVVRNTVNTDPIGESQIIPLVTMRQERIIQLQQTIVKNNSIIKRLQEKQLRILWKKVKSKPPANLNQYIENTIEGLCTLNLSFLKSYIIHYYFPYRSRMYQEFNYLFKDWNFPKLQAYKGKIQYLLGNDFYRMLELPIDLLRIFILMEYKFKHRLHYTDVANFIFTLLSTYPIPPTACRKLKAHKATDPNRVKNRKGIRRYNKLAQRCIFFPALPPLRFLKACFLKVNLNKRMKRYERLIMMESHKIRKYNN